MRLCLLLALTVLASLSAPLALAQGAAPGEVRFDFESGDLQGWQVVEGGFDLLVCDRATFHNTGEPYNKQGKFFLSTLEQSDYRPSDRFTGVIQSPVFALAGPRVSFLVGGGSHPDTYVALCSEPGEELLQARGKNTETMQPIQWDVPELVGRKVFVRVVDGNTGGWGHTTFDDFTARGAIDPEATATGFARASELLEELRLAGLPSPGDPRTLRAAIRDLMESFGDRYPRGKEFLGKLDEFETHFGDQWPPASREAKQKFAALQREALVANPLVSGRPILFVVRPQYLPDHHNTATMFQPGEINAASFRGGGAIKSLDLAAGDRATTLVDSPTGIARDPDVNFAADRIVFSMRRDAADDYHIYEMSSDGSGLRQLTFAPGVSDIDPLYLPDGRIGFSSTREPKYCMCNRHIMANLFCMEPDGANIHQIGKSTLMEGHGSLTPDGRILYDRWEYVDRNFGDAQGLWTVNPDGTNHAVYWGNNTSSPGAVLDARVIPGEEYQTVCTFSSCHDRPWGALAIIDRQRGMDGRDGVVRTWPASAIETVDHGGFDSYVPLFPKYEDPCPLAEAGSYAGAGKFFLCSRMVGHGEQMGIYLLDVFGNEILLHTEAPGCFDPMPLAPRQRPPVLPARRDYAGQDGSFFIADVYQGTHMAGVKRGAVKWLRVVEFPEKRFWTSGAWNGQGQEAPAMNWHDFNNKRILGTAPVEADGSAHFSVPSDRFVYFQLLDENKMMVQSMRSGTMAQPGEKTSCVGCHDNRHTATQLPRNGVPLAARREPDRLQDWFGEARLFSYMKEVQPVLDKHCVACHDYGEKPGAKLNLAADRDLVFNASYNELWRRGMVKVVGAGPAEIQQAYSWGSHQSPVVTKLRSGHPAPLDPEVLERIITWIDINAPYYPTYAGAYHGNLGGRSPLDDPQVKRLSELTGVDFAGQAAFNTNPGPQVAFERPELSPCLGRWQDRNAPEYLEALQIITAGRDMLARTPRADMDGFVAAPLDAERDRKYAARLEIEKRNRAAIGEGRKVYDNDPG